MNDVNVIGSAVLVVITLGSFIGVIAKFTQPLNDLKVVIQKLNDNIDKLNAENQNQNRRLDKHGEEINHLTGRVDKLETKVSIYHGDK